MRTQTGQNNNFTLPLHSIDINNTFISFTKLKLWFQKLSFQNTHFNIAVFLIYFL